MSNKRNAFRPQIEALEQRALMSATQEMSVVTGAEAVFAEESIADQHQEEWANYSVHNTKWAQPNGKGSAITLTYSYSNLLNGRLKGISNAQARAAIEEALGLWARYAPLHFVEKADSGPAVSDQSYSANGHPLIRIGHLYIDGDHGSNTAAHAHYPGNTGLAGDVHFDNGDNWTAGKFLEVAVHEFGHALGLKHEDSTRSIMHDSLLSRYDGLGKAFLFQDDVNGIRALYGAGTGSVQSRSSSVGTSRPLTPSGTSSDTTPTFTWSSATNATWYRLYIQNDSTGQTIYNEWHKGKTSLTFTGAFPEGKYRFWVQTYGNNKYGAWSSPKSFTISVPKPATTTLISPGGTLSDTTPTFRWNAAKNAAWYQLYVQQESSGKGVINQWLEGKTALTITSALPEGKYRFWVRTYGNNKYGEWSSPKSFTIRVAKPGTATLISPGNIISDTTPTLTWKAANNATWYRLYVQNETTKKGVFDQWLEGKTSYTFTNALAEGKYRFWVQTYGNGKVGDWSSPREFTISVPKPATATLLSPGGTTSDTTPTFQWNTAKNASWYRLYVQNDTTGKGVFDQWLEGKSSHTITNALAEGKYRFWVQSYGNGKVGEWSSAKKFTISIPKPDTATLLSPGGTISDTTPTLKWNAANNASWYRLYVQNEDTKKGVFDQWLEGKTSHTLTTALANGNYRFWVQTYGNGKLGEWSSAKSFIVAPKELEFGVYLAKGYVFVGKKEDILARSCAGTRGWGLEGTVRDHLSGDEEMILISPKLRKWGRSPGMVKCKREGNATFAVGVCTV